MKSILQLTALSLLFIFGSCYLMKAQSALPPLNKKITVLTKESIGQQIGRGECWDLAKFVLDEVRAEWKAPYDYGDIVDPIEIEIFPGDIIQFEKVELSNGDNYFHHTAIVIEVLEKGKYIMAHQNFDGVDKVTTRTLDLILLKKGTIDFYRPRRTLVD